MTEITPALLAEFKHRVPDDVTIPAHTPALAIGKAAGSLTLLLNGWGYDRPVAEFSPVLTAWTREPIRQPLPTRFGAILRDVTLHNGRRYDSAMLADPEELEPWLCIEPSTGDTWWLHGDDLKSWTVVSEGVELP